MSLFSSAVGLNPYTLIAGAVAVASITATIAYQNHEVHTWHLRYNTLNIADQKAIASKDAEIADMVNAQKNQTNITAGNVTKVVTVPGPVQTVVKTIHDAPEPPNCATPTLSEDDTNAF